ncbi:MAG: low molecular weight protein arginine phosphatase, partial [Chloroflexota bacterium]
HILFVCTANICRSPVAEGILRQRLKDAFMDGWTVSSAGTWAMQERGASRNSIVVMNERGIDISDHVARGVDEEMLGEADLILCMEAGHAEALAAEFPEETAGKLYMLTQMVGRRNDVADPYGAELPEYQQMADEVEELIDKALPRIKQLASDNAQSRWGVK